MLRRRLSCAATLIFIRHIVFYGNFGFALLPRNSGLTFRSAFRQTSSVEAEIDCMLQSNSR